MATGLWLITVTSLHLCPAAHPGEVVDFLHTQLKKTTETNRVTSRHHLTLPETGLFQVKQETGVTTTRRIAATFLPPPESSRSVPSARLGPGSLRPRPANQQPPGNPQQIFEPVRLTELSTAHLKDAAVSGSGGARLAPACEWRILVMRTKTGGNHEKRQDGSKQTSYCW
ncbi:hypothetical protein Bbelb_424060 [Branchiostoma belcheri]|nr:hypothetical protein Bbelb_424060 [Branchiostoma belcheri]